MTVEPCRDNCRVALRAPRCRSHASGSCSCPKRRNRLAQLLPETSPAQLQLTPRAAAPEVPGALGRPDLAVDLLCYSGPHSLTLSLVRSFALSVLIAVAPSLSISISISILISISISVSISIPNIYIYLYLYLSVSVSLFIFVCLSLCLPI